MKIINTILISLGIFCLIMRTKAGLDVDEISNYEPGITSFDLFFFKWGLFVFLVTTTVLLFANISNKIIKEGKDVNNKVTSQRMFAVLSFTNVFSIFSLYFENDDAILKSGWFGLFDFPFFWSSIFLLLFWFSMPGIKKLITQHEKSDLENFTEK